MHNSTYGSIIFPIGFAGNHLRWLLYLDQKFPSISTDQGIDSKLNFIRNMVYGDNRTWNNWLNIEWQYRTQLDDVLTVRHDCWNWKNFSNSKELYLSMDDYQKCFLHYYHINLGLNSNTPESLLEQITEWVDEFEFIKKRITDFPNKKIIKADPLFEKVLSQSFYQEVVDFYGLENNYNIASEVHRLYFESRKKSAKDFYRYFTSAKFKDILTQVHEISQN